MALNLLKPKVLVPDSAEAFCGISSLDLCSCKQDAVLESLLPSFAAVSHLAIKDASLLQLAKFTNLQRLDLQGCCYLT